MLSLDPPSEISLDVSMLSLDPPSEFRSTTSTSSSNTEEEGSESKVDAVVYQMPSMWTYCH